MVTLNVIVSVLRGEGVLQLWQWEKGYVHIWKVLEG